MRTRNWMFLTLILAMTGGCESNPLSPSGVVQSEPRVINPEIQKRIAERRTQQFGAEYPDLSEISTELPEQYEAQTIAQFETELMGMRENLLAGISTDRVQAREDETITALVRANGRLVQLSLEEAATVLKQALQMDWNNAQSTRRGGVPTLGGSPPKAQRE